MSGKSRDGDGRYLVGHAEPGPGRPSGYDPSMNDIARKLALLGLTNDEMAVFFGVSTQTLENWFKAEPAFFASVQDGKTIADANVAESLYKRATGEFVVVDKVYTNKQTGAHEAMKVSTYIPGESGAALNWLKNRRKNDWRDKHEVDVTGNLKLERIVQEIVDPKDPSPP